MDTVTGNVLVADAGSASFHLAVVDERDRVLATRDADEPPNEDAGRLIKEFLADAPAVEGCGHRIVHGGPDIAAPTVVNDRVRARLGAVSALAPLHMPPALAALDAARQVLPGMPQVACPDTAFHHALPEPARTYALPRELTRRHGLRRYGFHGLSYAHALRRTAALLGRPPSDLQLLITHLGGGCSACAVRGGRSVDTTMGMTPAEGLPMSSRSGTVDPGMLLWLQAETSMEPERLSEVLTRESGLLGLSGTSGDTRDLVRSRAASDADAALALDTFTLGVRRGIAAVAASLDHVDALVFTGEIGEDQPEVREAVAAGLGVLGIEGGLASAHPGEPSIVSRPGAAVPVIVVPTGEITQIARETRACLHTRH
ncbi:acetate/propionate family kinase [Streptomyces erythrochromogenes]|uniref:acetate/propionate family kinase n=1 Tax=Streptomyces erythrochromogenes TaxID=285574 RepID=UPI0036BB3C53